MLFASFMREGCRVKLRLAPADENRFLAQLSIDERDSSTLLFLVKNSEAEFFKSETRA